MSVSEDVRTGLLCMKCQQWLIADDGTVCEAGHPLYCRECWLDLPRIERQTGAPYFDERDGQIHTA